MSNACLSTFLSKLSIHYHCICLFCRWGSHAPQTQASFVSVGSQSLLISELLWAMGLNIFWPKVSHFTGCKPLSIVLWLSTEFHKQAYHDQLISVIIQVLNIGIHWGVWTTTRFRALTRGTIPFGVCTCTCFNNWQPSQITGQTALSWVHKSGFGIPTRTLIKTASQDFWIKICLYSWTVLAETQEGQAILYSCNTSL